MNTAADESDVRALDSLAEAEADLDPSLFVRHLELSRYLMALALLLLVIQALVSLRRPS